MKSESIIEGGNEYECWFCGCTGQLHRHHIFFGHKNRNLSEKYGCWVYLCREHHEGTEGIHGKRGHEKDLTLKKVAQRAWEAQKGSREEFRAIFGKSYIDDDNVAEIASERG